MTVIGFAQRSANYMPKEATMDKKAQDARVWLSDIHTLWQGWIPQHPQHKRFAPLPPSVTKRRG